MKKVLSVIAAVSVLLSCDLAFSQGMPDEYVKDAVSKVRVAQQLMAKANALARNNPRDETLRTSMQLYAQAGQMFQEAGVIFKALGPDRVRPEDIDACTKASEACLKAINQIKVILQRPNR